MNFIENDEIYIISKDGCLYTRIPPEELSFREEFLLIGDLDEINLDNILIIGKMVENGTISYAIWMDPILNSLKKIGEKEEK